jgi:hypothetical protein
MRGRGPLRSGPRSIRGGCSRCGPQSAKVTPHPCGRRTSRFQSRTLLHVGPAHRSAHVDGLRNSGAADSNGDSNGSHHRQPSAHVGHRLTSAWRLRTGPMSLLKGGRSAVRPRPCPPPETSENSVRPAQTRSCAVRVVSGCVRPSPSGGGWLCPICAQALALLYCADAAPGVPLPLGRTVRTDVRRPDVAGSGVALRLLGRPLHGHRAAALGTARRACGLFRPVPSRGPAEVTQETFVALGQSTYRRRGLRPREHCLAWT